MTTTPTNQELQRTLAAMLPDVIKETKSSLPGYNGRFRWLTKRQWVHDTELDYLVRLAESRLTPSQREQYAHELRTVVMEECNKPEFYVPGGERAQLIANFWFYCASLPQRVIALSRVHQPAGREEGV